jgi:hypothetical protein
MPKPKQEVKSTVVEITSIRTNFPRIESFVIKATIPTGQYANIQPEMTINDVTIEDVENIILPKIDAMIEKYLNFNDVVLQNRNAQKAVAPQAPVAPQVPTTTVTEKSNAFINAENMLVSAQNPDAVQVIKQQITNSIKLTDAEKKVLLALK